MNTPKIKMLVLSLTGQCTFACKYCYAAEHDGSMLKAVSYTHLTLPTT